MRRDSLGRVGLLCCRNRGTCRAGLANSRDSITREQGDREGAAMSAMEEQIYNQTSSDETQIHNSGT